VKVTADPGQNGLADAEMVIPAGSVAFTTMVMAFDVAGLLDVQTVLDEVRMHVTISPFTGG
jgi:hypothetical protein